MTDNASSVGGALVESEGEDLNESSNMIQYDRYGFYGGKEYTNPEKDRRLPVKIIRSREMKWREMCNNWEWWITRNRFKVRVRCAKGIPDSMRCEAWQRLCNSPMVLISRPKVIVALSSTALRKQGRSKGLLGTLSRNANSRSLPTVITTSPSFRTKRGKDEDRNEANLSPVPLFPEIETMNRVPYDESLFPSLRMHKHSSPVLSGERTGETGVLSSTRVTDTGDFLNWPLNESMGNSADHSGIAISRATSGSFHSLAYDGLDGLAPLTSPPLASYSTYTASVSVHNTSVSSIPVAGGYNIVVSDQAAVASSSGGYASLSTNSCTDSASIRNTANHPLPPDALSRGSYGSSLNSSSVASSSSMLWPHGTDAAVNRDSNSIEEARKTLVPHEVSDPVSLYEHYCSQDGLASNCDQIRRDIDRQFPFHELFSQKGGHGQQSLYTLLKAYTIRHADKGYCQGQAPLAAVLLMFMPEVDAFWTFNEVCERYLEAYYDDGLERIQIDGEILYAFLKSAQHAIYKFLKRNCIEPIFIVLEWFMCVYTRTLPWSVVLRVLDMFFCEGKVVLFRVAIVLLRRLFGTRALRKCCPGADEVLARLRDVHLAVPDTEEFVREVTRIELTPRDVGQEAIRQSHKWERRKQLKTAAVTPIV